jgi:hypothetical protein
MAIKVSSNSPCYHSIITNKGHSSYLCIAENNEPPNTPATPNMWNGCIKMLCSAWNTIMKLKVPEIMNIGEKSAVFLSSVYCGRLVFSYKIRLYLYLFCSKILTVWGTISPCSLLSSYYERDSRSTFMNLD